MTNGGSLLDVVAEPGSFLDEMEVSRLGLGELERYPTDILTIILYPPDDIIIADGQTIEPENSGQANLGTSSKLFGVVYTEGVRTDTITANDYIVALGGLHVGGAGDPGTDNLIVDLDTRIGGGLYVGSTGTDPDVGQLFLDQGAGDYAIITHISSDVAHGMTDLAATDVFGNIQKVDADAGGLAVRGFKDADGGNNAAMQLVAYLGENVDTTKSQAGRGIMESYAAQISGTAQGNVVADGNCFVWRAWRGGAWVTLFIIDEDGDLHRDGAEGTFDEYDDAHLCRVFDLAVSPGGIVESEFDEFLKHNEATLRQIGILGSNPDDTFYSITALQRLHNGAIWQLYMKLKEQEMELVRLRQVLVNQETVALQAPA